MEKIVIRAIDRPRAGNQNEMIKWFCEALGLVGDDGKGGIEVELMKQLLAAAARGEGISSSEIKPRQDIARSTVIYHLNRFIESGLVVKHGRKYYFRGKGLSTTLEELEYDINKEMMRMLDIAREFDRAFIAAGRRGRRVRIE